MSIKKYIPQVIKDHYRLLKIQKLFGPNVLSSHVHTAATLGKEVYIASNVDIRARVKIGDYSYVNHGTLIASGYIGKFC